MTYHWDREMARVIALEEIEDNLQVTKWRIFYENERFIFQYHKSQEAYFPGTFVQRLSWKDFYVDPEAQHNCMLNQDNFGYDEVME